MTKLKSVDILYLQAYVNAISMALLRLASLLLHTFAVYTQELTAGGSHNLGAVNANPHDHRLFRFG